MIKIKSNLNEVLLKILDQDWIAIGCQNLHWSDHTQMAVEVCIDTFRLASDTVYVKEQDFK